MGWHTAIEPETLEIVACAFGTVVSRVSMAQAGRQCRPAWHGGTIRQAMLPGGWWQAGQGVLSSIPGGWAAGRNVLVCGRFSPSALSPAPTFHGGALRRFCRSSELSRSGVAFRRRSYSAKILFGPAASCHGKPVVIGHFIAFAFCGTPGRNFGVCHQSVAVCDLALWHTAVSFSCFIGFLEHVPIFVLKPEFIHIFV